MDFFGILISIIILVTFYIYWKLKKLLALFDDNGVPYVKPNWIFGNLTDAFLLKKPIITVFDELYEKLRPNKFGGFLIMQKPGYLILDPDLIKTVMIKDFSYFQNRGIAVNREVEPLSYHIFNMNGDEWKNLRIKLTSIFSTGKMKMMFPLVKDCGEHLTKVINNMGSEETFDVKDLVGRYTTDVIGSCAFGIEMHSLDNPNSEFRLMGKKIVAFRYSSVFRSAFPILPKNIIKLLDMKLVDDKVSNFFKDIVHKTVKYREENNVLRYDFLDLMIALKNNTVLEKYHDIQNISNDLERFMSQIGKKYVKNNVEMTVDLMAAQCFLFFVAGFETTASTLSFLMLEISKNQEIQEKLRNEINAVLKYHKNEVTYESVKEMTYMDMVIAETLRLYPPVGLLVRQCNEPYMIPNTKVVISKKMPILIPIHAIHRDKSYYERPKDFYPEHFTEEAKTSRPHCTYLPFGEGPRSCIAGRFANLQVKVGLVSMLQNFSYQLSPKMKLPVEFDTKFDSTSVIGGILLTRSEI